MAAQLTHRLYDVMRPLAGTAEIESVWLGLGYTAVSTSTGGLGLAYTYFDRKTGCTLVPAYRDFEGAPALELLTLIKHRHPLERTMALALINALNQGNVDSLPADKGNRTLLEALGIHRSARVAMVGFIKPLVKRLQSKGVAVEVIDEFRNMGDKASFYRKLRQWADAALISSTCLLNNTFEEIMDHVGPNVKAALLGPSTPMVADAFRDWPAIRALAGTVPLEREPILRAVRHGLGTPYLHKFSKKATLTIE